MRISDWSSDVCSSDLEGFIGPFALQGRVAGDGTLTYFEMLTRIGGGTAGFTALGLNPSRLLVELFAGRALPDPAGTAAAGGAAAAEWQGSPCPVRQDRTPWWVAEAGAQAIT